MAKWRAEALVATLAFLLCGCDAGPGDGAASSSSPAVIFDAAAVPADFVTLRHISEDLVIRAPTDWAYLPQQFQRQNDVLVGLYPPGSVWTDENTTRLFLHGHVLPNGVTFDQYVRGHESGSFASNEGQTYLSSEPARLNGLPAHRWVSVGQPPDGRPKTKRLMVAAGKGQTVYYFEFRCPPEHYDRLAPVVEQIISSLTIGEPKPWPTPPPPAIPRQRPATPSPTR